MSIFKKHKNPNIRQRVLEDEDETEEENKSDICHELPKIKPPSPPSFRPQISGPTRTMFDKKVKKNKQKKDRQVAVLSFGDELEADDGEVFQEKKSNLSLKLRKELKKERREKKRIMKEGKERDNGKSESTPQSELQEMGIRIINGREAEVISIRPGDSDSDNDEQQPPKPVFNKFPSAKNSAVPLGSSIKSVLQTGLIPDANLIHKIRKEREKARKQGQFIPLDDTVRHEENSSRLIREDDNDISENEEDKIQFSVNQDEIDKRQRREVFDAAQQDGSDKEDSNWEMQQLKKAGASQIPPKNSSDCGFEQVGAGSNSNFMNSDGQVGESYLQNAQDSLNAPMQAISINKLENYEADTIIERLKNSRESFNELVQRHQKEADEIVDDIISSNAAIETSQESKDPLYDSFKLYQDMRGYVTDLRDCLNEKVPEIKRLENQVYLIYRQKAQHIIQRRRQDVKDQNNEYSPFAGKASKGDEYRIRRAAEREGRRTRRRREREKKAIKSHHDGASTDDELPTAFQQTMDKELDSFPSQVATLFEDVEEEFSSLAGIMTPFEEWRRSNLPSYVDAYVSYNLPKVFSPFIRMQLLLWNPLDEYSESPDIEKMLWFNDLLYFGANFEREDEASAVQFDQDPDKRLITNVVEKVVLVKLKDIVSSFWDPLSHVQSVRLVNLIRHYTSSYPSLSPSSKQLKELLQAIVSRIRDTIENDVFIPMFPKCVYESKTSAVSLFFHRQFWSAWKLLAAVLMWHRILNDRIIQDLAIRSLLNLYLVPALTLAADIHVHDALDKARYILNVLPREWCKGEDGVTHPFLDRLEGFFTSVCSKLDPAANLKEIKQIADILKFMGSKKQSKLIYNKYL